MATGPVALGCGLRGVHGESVPSVIHLRDAWHHSWRAALPPPRGVNRRGRSKLAASLPRSFLVFVTDLPSTSISGVGEVLADGPEPSPVGVLMRAGCTAQLTPRRPRAGLWAGSARASDEHTAPALTVDMCSHLAVLRAQWRELKETAALWASAARESMLQMEGLRGREVQ